MPTLTDAEIYQSVVLAGFPADAQITAIAVALAESGGNSDATNTNADGSTDYGLFQINSVHADLLRGKDWKNPVTNAMMALAVSSNGTNWHPWVAYDSGAWTVYIARARAAAHAKPGLKAHEGSGNGPIGGAVGGVVNGWEAIGNFFSILLDGRTWVRIAYVVVGFVVILVALSLLTEVDNKIAKAGIELAVFRKVGMKK